MGSRNWRSYQEEATLHLQRVATARARGESVSGHMDNAQKAIERAQHADHTPVEPPDPED